ncbi:MAG TPA: hypothetical protein ENH08_03730 [Chromatiales bacterium]|nr:hypothetical protein [Chromatiales bacterium]
MSLFPPSAPGLKYSLFDGRPGVRAVGYDNERGQGDHRHSRGAETAYAFKGARPRLQQGSRGGPALVAAGLLDIGDGGVQADYEAIETKIAI